MRHGPTGSRGTQNEFGAICGRTSARPCGAARSRDGHARRELVDPRLRLRVSRVRSRLLRMRDRARAVVVGGGVGGCSVLYWLARLGWNDVVLLERAELTS